MIHSGSPNAFNPKMGRRVRAQLANKFIMEKFLNGFQEELNGRVDANLASLFTSGVIGSYSKLIKANSPTIIAINKFKAVVDGKIITIPKDFSATRPATTSLVWLEVWEELVDYTKALKEFGYDVGDAVTNTLLDARLSGVETEKAVILRSRIRITEGVNFGTYPQGFSTGATPNLQIIPQCGLASVPSASTVSTAMGASVNKAYYRWAGAADAMMEDLDTGLWINGSTVDAESTTMKSLFNTYNGVAWAIPLFKLTPNAGSASTIEFLTTGIKFRLPINSPQIIGDMYDSIGNPVLGLIDGDTLLTNGAKLKLKPSADGVNYTVEVSREAGGDAGLNIITRGNVPIQVNGINVQTSEGKVKRLAVLSDSVKDLTPAWYVTAGEAAINLGTLQFIYMGSELGLPEGKYLVTVDVPYSNTNVDKVRMTAKLMKNYNNSALVGMIYHRVSKSSTTWTPWRREDLQERGALAYAVDPWIIAGDGVLEADTKASMLKSLKTASSTTVVTTAATTQPDNLRFGRYNALARVKSSNKTVNATITLTVSKKLANSTYQVIATKTYNHNQLTANDTYQTLYVDFEWAGAELDNQLELKVTQGVSATAVNLNVDYLEIMPTTTGMFL